MSLAQRSMDPAISDAVTLLATIEIAIQSRHWVVDGACDPDGLICGLNDAVKKGDVGKAMHLTGALASDCLQAMASGDWIPMAGDLDFVSRIAVLEPTYPALILAL